MQIQRIPKYGHRRSFDFAIKDTRKCKNPLMGKRQRANSIIVMASFYVSSFRHLHLVISDLSNGGYQHIFRKGNGFFLSFSLSLSFLWHILPLDHKAAKEKWSLRRWNCHSLKVFICIIEHWASGNILSVLYDPKQITFRYILRYLSWRKRKCKLVKAL